MTAPDKKPSPKFSGRFDIPSRLRPLIFVVIFAVIGVIYLVASHAAITTDVTIQGTQYPGGWYRNSASFVIRYSTACSGETKVAPVVNLEGRRIYYFWQDSSGNPYMSVSPNEPNTIPGLDYCNRNANYSEVWKVQIGIDAIAPSVSFSSPANSTTQNSSILVGGNASDPDSGLASVTVNGTAATLSGGGFVATVPLVVGTNKLVATATDHVGHATATPAITVTRTVPPPSPPAGGSSAPKSGSSSPVGGSSKSSKSPGSASSSSGGAATPTTSAGGATTTDTSDLAANTDNVDTTDVASNSSPNVPAGKTVTLTSDNNKVRVTFPAGTFKVDAYCSIDSGDSRDVPSNSANVIGPYNVNCLDGDGNILDKPQKALDVAINLPSKGSSAYSAYTNSNNSWAKVPATNAKGKLQFKLVSTKLFAAASAKKGASKWGLILNILGVIIFLLLIIGGIAFAIQRRQQQETTPGGY